MNVLDAMRDTMVHRGPDDCGSWAHGPVGLAHRRLSIVDLSAHGRQPMPNEDKTVWTTYNGEIYNHRSLRMELEARGHVFRSNTDTEVLVHLFEESGPGCVDRLQGMFAFAIWDARRRELMLVRDRLGVKPLYYVQLPHALIFASEIKALLRHPDVRPELDGVALAAYLSYGSVPSPRTMFRGIAKLGPAQRLRCTSSGQVRVKTYWSPFDADSARAGVQSMGPAEQRESFRELLREAVLKRLMADVPVGVLLSGGVDSSLLAALAAEHAPRAVRSFCVTMPGHAAHDEAGYARTVSARLGTEHHEIELTADRFASELSTIVYHNDEPPGDWTSASALLVARLAREHDTPVLLTGEGADEVFHGYSGFVSYVRWKHHIEALGRLPPSLREAMRGALRMTVGSRPGMARASETLSLGLAGRHLFWGGTVGFKPELREKVLPGLAGFMEDVETPEAYWNEIPSGGSAAIDILQRMTYVELRNRLPELLLSRTDKMTMAQSIEARVPFLDHELVELAMALPRSAKIKGNVGKSIVKELAAELVGRDVVYRQKRGFSPPVSQWMREAFGRGAERQTLESTLLDQGIVDPRAVTQLWREHRSGTVDHGYVLWLLLSAGLWHDRWVAGRALSELAA